MNRSRNLTATLLRYGHVFMIQGSQTALANGRGRLDERLAVAREHRAEVVEEAVRDAWRYFPSDRWRRTGARSRFP